MAPKTYWMSNKTKKISQNGWFFTYNGVSTVGSNLIGWGILIKLKLNDTNLY